MSTGTRIQRQVDNLKRESRKIAPPATISPLVETAMRLGFVVRGLIYMIMGVLAVQVASSRNGTLLDPQGAIATMGKTPLGGLLLYVILVGLIAYALWGIIRAIFDPLHRGTRPEGLAVRAGYLVSGISYAVLALATYGLITSRASAAQNGSQTAQAQQITANIFTYSWAPWVVGIAGVLLTTAGLI